MRKLLIAGAAFAALVGSAAADPGDNGNHRGHRGEQAAQTQDNNATQRGASERSDRAAKRSDNAQRGGNMFDASNRGNDNQRNANRNVNVERNVTVNRDVNVQRNINENRNVTVNRNVTMDRNHRNNFSVAQYQRNMRSTHRYRAARYNAPRGYSYHRWSYGQRLPSSYFARNYWLTDFVTFGLFAPPSGYVWVRYGDDALLIDEFTGEIIQVRYDVFWS